MRPLTERDPDRYGDWQLLARIAEGGMGVVYLAGRDGEVGALKAVRHQLAWDEHYRQRFRHEVDALRSVRSPFVIQFRDADADAEIPWLAMDYEPATSLDVNVRRSGPLQRFHGLRFLSKLAQGIASLHDVGIVHRDLKPSNILVTDNGPRILDLGIARVRESSTTGTYGPLTEAWASPEQLEANPEVSPATDVFNIGLVAGFALTGLHPFGRPESTRAVAAMVVAMCSGRPTHLQVDDDIRELLQACFAAPSERPRPEELARGLTSLARGAHLDVAHSDFGSGNLPWRVPKRLGRRVTEGTEPPPTAARELVTPQRASDASGHFIVVSASRGWNPLVGLDYEVSSALRAASIKAMRVEGELRWRWANHEFVLPLDGELTAPEPGATLWDWLDEHARRLEIEGREADVGGRLVYFSKPSDELFISLNPDVIPGQSHFVALETDDETALEASDMVRGDRAGRKRRWDEAEEERLATEFLRGVPIHELAGAFGRPARDLCKRLEVLGVLERLDA